MSWYEEQVEEEVARIKANYRLYANYLYNLRLDEPKSMLKSIRMFGAYKSNKGADKTI